MYMQKISIVIICIFANSIFNLSLAFSEEVLTHGEQGKIETASVPPKKTNEILEEIKWLQAEAVITIATKHKTPISKAPGIATVITSKQIKQMGFRTLVDILKLVPGFYISMDETGEREIAVRGVLDDASQKIKILIDGHSINDVWRGGATWNFDDLVVENIKRIEVIRGPGSALYGQNAFLAVVNIITKDTEDIDGFQVTASGGSFSTQNYNLLFGREFGDLKISGFLDYFDTEGFDRKIEQDILFPEPFSMSPGRSQNEKEKTDLNLKLSYKNLELNGKYMKKRREDYIGVGDALNNDTDLKDTYFFTELAYKLEAEYDSKGVLRPVQLRPLF
jgi:iron complex outermembrane receptor protein